MRTITLCFTKLIVPTFGFQTASPTKSPCRKPYFFPKHLRPQFAHALVIAHHFFIDFHFIGIAQAGVVLLLAVEAVGGAGLVGEGVADEAGVGGDVEQGDVAVVVEQLRQFVCIRQNQVLHDEFDIDHAAALQAWRASGAERVDPVRFRFIEAMVSIRGEIRRIESGELPADNNPLKHAPHSQADVIDSAWNRPYSRQEAVFPLPWVAANKFWPSVNRIDDVYGDRNLNCACPPMEAYAD